MNQLRLSGVWAAVLTPVTIGLEPDAAKAALYYGDLLQGGCDGLNILGTTGEAMSFSVKQRLQFMEGIAGTGLPMDRVMVGTGAASLDDACTLTRKAAELGFAAVLVMPPFFYRDAGDDGILRFYDALLTKSHVSCLLLYNFPRMSGITFRSALVAQLLDEFAHCIVGMKDSSNDRELQRALVEAHPGFAVFAGSEHSLLDATGAGAVGCISGSVCLWPKLAGDVLRTRDAALGRRLTALREALDGPPLITAVRYLVAQARNEDVWEQPMPPLVPLASEKRSTIDAALKPLQR